MIKTVILAFLIALSSFSHADQYAHLGALSKHLTGSQGLNEVHRLVGYENDWVEFVYFNNSHQDDTFAISYPYEKYISQRTMILASIGVSYGYRICWDEHDSEQDVCPHGYGGVGYDVPEWKFKIADQEVIPRLTFKVYGINIVVFSPEFKF